MNTLDDIRKAFPDAANASDLEILTELSRRTGKPIPDVATDWGVDVGQNNGDFTRGLRRGWEQTKGAAGGLVGLGADMLGAEGIKRGALDYARGRFEQDALLARPTDDITNISSVGDAVDFAQAGIGQLVPMVLGGGAAGVGGRVVGGALARRGAAVLAGDAAKAAVARGATRGMTAGLAAQSIGQESGSIYSDMVADGNDDSLRALAFGTAAGALDVIPEMRALRRVFGDVPGATGNLVRRVTREGAKQAGMEAGTEVGQTALELQANYKDLVDEEALRAYANAGALGALGGGAIGALGGIRGQRAPITDRPADLLNPDYGDAPQLLETPPGAGVIPQAEGPASLPALNELAPEVSAAPTLDAGTPGVQDPYEYAPEARAIERREGFPRLYGTPTERTATADLPQLNTPIPVGGPSTAAFSEQPIGDTLPGALELARQRALAGPIVENELVPQTGAGSATGSPDAGGSAGVVRPGVVGPVEAVASGTGAPASGGAALQPVADGTADAQPSLTVEALKEQYGLKTGKRTNKLREAALGRIAALTNAGAIPEDAIAQRMAWVKAGRIEDVNQANDVDEQSFVSAMEPEEQVRYMLDTLPAQMRDVLDLTALGTLDAEIANKYGHEDKQWAQKQRSAAVAIISDIATRLGLNAAAVKEAMNARPPAPVAVDTEASVTSQDAANLGLNAAEDSGESTGFQIINRGADLGNFERAATDPADVVEFGRTDNTDLTARETDADTVQLQAARDRYEGWRGAGDPEWNQWGPQQKKRWARLDQALEDGALQDTGFDRAGIEMLDEAEQGNFYSRTPYIGQELTTTDEAGRTWTYRYMNLARYPQVMEAMRALVASPVGRAYDNISGVYLSNDTGADAFVVPEGDGMYRLVLTQEFLARASDADVLRTVNHEVAHVADDSAGAARFSSSALWKSIAVDAQLKFNTLLPNLKRFLRYPMADDTVAPDAFAAEVFAQAWAAYADPQLRPSLQQQLPVVHFYVEEKYGAYARADGQDQGGDTRAAGGQVEDDAGAGGAVEDQTRPDSDVGGDGSGGARGEGVIRIRFAKPAQVGRAESIVKSVLAAPSTRTVRGMARKVNYSLLFGHQLVDRISEMLPAARQFFRTLQDRITLRDRREARVMEVAEKFYKLDQAEQARTNRFIFESTSSQKWGYVPAWDAAVQVDADMAEKFAALSPEAQAIVKDVFAYGNETQWEYEQVLRQTIGAEIETQRAEAEAAGDTKRLAALAKEWDKLKRENAALKSMLAGPYAPLKRFGKFALVMKSEQYRRAEADGDRAAIEKLQADPQHYMVQFFETRYEAERAYADALPKYGDNLDQPFEREPENSRSTELPIQAIKRLQNAITQGPNGEKLSDRSKRILARITSDLYVASLDSMSSRHSQQRRRNIAGADEDMMRAFVSQGRGMAHMLATLEVNGPMQESLQQMRAQARTGRTPEKADALNEVLNRYTLLMDTRPTPVQDALMATTSLWMLLTNPAYWFGNATQPFMMTLPVLAGRFNAGASWAAVLQGYGDTMAALEGRALDPMKVKSKVAREGEMLQTLLDRGHIDLTLEREMGELSGRWHVGHKVMNLARFIPQRVEVANRVASAVAAYRLEYMRAVQKGAAPDVAHDQATEYADTIILDTHGDYSSAGAPRLLMQGNTQLPVKLMGQFRKFQLVQLGLVAKLVRQSFGDANLTAEERTAARWSLAWLMGTFATMTGLLGTIGTNVIWGLLSSVFGDDDEKDLDLVLTRALGDRDAAILLTRGVPALLGVDVSQRLGMGNVLSLFPYADTEPTVKDSYTAYVMAATGPFIGGLLPRAANGMDYIRKGDYWKGVELLVPNGVTNLMRASRFTMGDGLSNAKGDTLMTPDEVGVLSGIFQAAGLPTTVLTDRQWKSSVLYELEAQLRDDATSIKKRYTEAAKERDTETMAELRGEWMQMQKVRERNGLKPQPLSTLLKAPKQQREREELADEGVALTKSNAGFTESVPD